MGYTQLENIILETIYSLGLTGSQLRVLLMIIRYTAGFHRKECEMSYTYIQNGTKLSRSSVRKAVLRLLEIGIIYQAECPTPSAPRRLGIRREFFLGDFECVEKPAEQDEPTEACLQEEAVAVELEGATAELEGCDSAGFEGCDSVEFEGCDVADKSPVDDWFGRDHIAAQDGAALPFTGNENRGISHQKSKAQLLAEKKPSPRSSGYADGIIAMLSGKSGDCGSKSPSLTENDNKSQQSEPSAEGVPLLSPQPKRAFGLFENVMLTDGERDMLRARYGARDEQIINNFSAKLKSKGYTYSDHYATIILWGLQDESSQAEKEAERKQAERERGFDTDDFFTAALNSTYKNMTGLMF